LAGRSAAGCGGDPGMAMAGDVKPPKIMGASPAKMGKDSKKKRRDLANQKWLAGWQLWMELDVIPICEANVK